jgi:membrane fusion protein, multidrug efflux system
MMKNKLNHNIITLAFFLAGSMLLSACGSASREENDTAPAAVSVRVQATQVETLENTLELTGVVQPFEEAHIGASMPMRIERILVDVGDNVSKGQLLVQMDRTQLQQARVQRETLKGDLQRIDTLLRMGAATQQTYDQLRAQYDVAASTVENLEQTTEIRATIPGVVTGRYNSDGEVFTMTPGPAGRPAIVTVMQLRPVKITIGVSERHYQYVKQGQTAAITSDIFPGREFPGRVHKVHPTIDRMSGTFKVEIIVDNADLSLKPGMFTRVSLGLGQYEGLLVPALSVLKQPGSNERFVFVVEDGKAIRKTVQPGRNFDDMIEIVHGLEEGETLVTTGQHNLLHLNQVEIVQ